MNYSGDVGSVSRSDADRGEELEDDDASLEVDSSPKPKKPIGKVAMKGTSWVMTHRPPSRSTDEGAPVGTSLAL